MKRAAEAAAQGDPDGQIALGRMYEQGDGFPQNFPEAIRWYMKAAAASPRAKHLVGLMYANGRGVSRDRDIALKWIAEAATGGCAEAQHMLGSMYARGKGVPRDMEKAAAWFRMAAENGDDGAQLIFGLMLRDGRGVPRDDIAAYVWISCAVASRPAGQKREIAIEALESVARRLDAERLREAQVRLLATGPAAGSPGPVAHAAIDRISGRPVHS